MPRSIWVAVALAATLIAGIGYWTARRSPAAAIVRLAATPQGSIVVGGGRAGRAAQDAGSDVAISSDGRHIVYVAGEDQAPPTLYVRALDRLEARPLDGLGAPQAPFVSPDGRWVGFFDDGWLKKIAIDGGAPVGISAVAGAPRGASWGADDSIIFATSDTSAGLLRVPAAGGTPETLTKPEASEVDHVLPRILPGGRAVLFTILAASAAGGSPSTQIAVLNLDTRAWRALIHGGSNPHYSASGHLLYVADGTVWAAPFDVTRQALLGPPVATMERVATKPGSGAASFDIAGNGTLVYVEGNSQAGNTDRTLVWVDRQGNEEPIPAPVRAYVYPRLSPDGGRIALDIRDQGNDIWIWDLSARALTRLTDDPGPNRGGVWSPDGRHVAYSGRAGDVESLYWRATDGTVTQLTRQPRPQTPLSFTPDGTRLFYLEPNGTQFDVGLLNLSGDRRTELLRHSAFNEQNAEVSPDGRGLAYDSDESGRTEVYVRPFPAIEGGRWQVSTDGGGRPAWSRDGRELFYWAVAGAIMAVPVRAGTTFTTGPPQAVVKGPYVSPQSGRSYDVSASGQRFVVIKDLRPPTAAAPALVVVLNWFEELKTLDAPASRN
jgi:Tol biopolymer transport system component